MIPAIAAGSTTRTFPAFNNRRNRASLILEFLKYLLLLFIQGSELVFRRRKTQRTLPHKQQLDKYDRPVVL